MSSFSLSGIPERLKRFGLPRTTERPVRKRGDECSEVLARQCTKSHGRKPVVRGLHYLGIVRSHIQPDSVDPWIITPKLVILLVAKGYSLG